MRGAKSIISSLYYLKLIRAFLVFAFFFSYVSSVNGQERTSFSTVTTELRDSIEKIMEETGIPAVGISMIGEDGSTWAAGLGKADIENNVDANEHTMFRIGSVSKMFVSLAILKLQEDGLLSLKDTVKNLVPEIEFNNPYADTSPILVAHLLEHTAAWSDLHLPEFALNAKGMTLREGLEYHPHSRFSRWKPGTRMAYSNSGPAVAAYIVEKVTDMVYEDYIQKNFFEPLKMTDATFFNSKLYQELGAKLYADNISQPYWHMIMRPSGAINASPKEMLNFLQFFINRGRIDSLPLISEQSLTRMETPSSTEAHQLGLEYGYGLSNQSSVYESFVYRRHLGGVANGLADFSYLPEYGVGYAVMISSGSVEGLRGIIELLRSTQTRNLAKPDLKLVHNSSNLDGLEGYYIPVNPRFDLFSFAEKIFGVQRMDVKENFLIKKGLTGEEERFVSDDGKVFKSPAIGKISMIRINDPIDGEVLHAGEQVLKRISAFTIYTFCTLCGSWLLFTFISLPLGIIWIIRRKIYKKVNKRIRLWSLFPSLIIGMIVLVLVIGINNFFQAFGMFGFISLSLFILSILFGLASIWAIFYAIRSYRREMNRLTYWYCTLLSALHFLVVCYFFKYGIIGITTWT